MKLKLKGYTYRKASDLERILEKAPKTEKELKIFCYLVGIYSCRFFGIVRYKTKAGYDTDKIQIGRKLSECTTDDASGSKLNMPLVSKAKRSVCGCYQPNIDNTTIPPNRK